ncbi:AraC family transcriptional regulator [Terrimonas sp.]|uniref:helix-turn-helix domain-containing protein n=1 Tax=Terrimonas sp. TaxID=1914338 RepID=UPI000D51ADD7|nr:helix-turn-helix domain-containing protein [Terrimonas sp.]PVD53134.1 AraC family transcriptional regulator [Terrimonas sp.]
MTKEKIPVYDICSLQDEHGVQDDFLADRFSDYLEKHYSHLHSPHRHSFFHLVLFTKGKGEHTIDFHTYPVKALQLYCMVPGQVHSWHFTGSTDGYIINFSDRFFKSFLLNPHYIERFSFFSGISNEGIIQIPSSSKDTVTRLFESIISTAKETREQRDMDKIRILLLQLFILLEDKTPELSNKSIPQQKMMLLRNFRKLIEDNYKNIRLPKQYAELLYVTPNHLNALCQDLIGKTAGELIRERVLLEAKRLLTNVNITAAEIAYELNFQDNSYFSRFFKKYSGYTPEAFRKQFDIKK